MKKLFISQPMADLTEEEILRVRAKAVESAERFLGEKVEVIDSYIEEQPPLTTNNFGLWYLGKSIEMLCEADVVYFCKGWEKYRGCKIENQCAIEYGLNVIEDYRED